MKETKIVDESNDRKYYSQIPNLVDDLGLSVYAFRLYCHLKRVTGEDGHCWQSAETLAVSCRMSTHKVSDAKKELVKNRLVRIGKEKRSQGGHDSDIITIEDIWARNIFQYAKSEGNDEQGSTGTLQGSDMHLKNNPPKNDADDEKNDAVALHMPPLRKNKNFSSEGGGKVHHQRPPAIEAIKIACGYYPQKATYQAIVNLLGNVVTPEVQKALNEAAALWIAGGSTHNPLNLNAWLFDRFVTGNQYMGPNDKHLLDYSYAPLEQGNQS